MRNRSFLALGAVAVLASIGNSSRALALDWLHEQRAEGGRWCMVDHFHQGASSGSHTTRQAAERDAAAGWSSFTSWEYGGSWGSWQLAGSKRANCSQQGSTWSCSVEARPCRPIAGGGGRSAKKK